VLLGPEGGFTAAEADAIREAGFQAVSLGARVLRAETAAIVVAALCQHRWGDG
jgi:16S rRNA (uracil1498-N3)-methyltransferase